MKGLRQNMVHKMTNSNREDYLQAIYRLSQEKGYTNNKHIAYYLEITKAAVSEMIYKLTEDGLIKLEGTKISLTEKGKVRAQAILSDHRLWEYFLFHTLGMEGDDIHAQADLLEHVTGEKLREALNRFLDYPTESPSGKVIYKNTSKSRQQH